VTQLIIKLSNIKMNFLFKNNYSRQGAKHAKIKLFKVTYLGPVNSKSLTGYCHPRMLLAGILRPIVQYSLKRFSLKAMGGAVHRCTVYGNNE